MTHIGAIFPPVSSHVDTMMALGKELKQRGHGVTFFQIPDVESKVLAEGLEFCSLGKSEHPLGSLDRFSAKMGTLSGLAAVRYGVMVTRNATDMLCREAPAALKQAGIEILLVDQGEPVGGTVAEYLRIPFVNVCSALAANYEASIPPIFTPWDYDNSWWACLRNQMGYFVHDWLIQPITAVLAHYRKQWKLPAHRGANDTCSPFAQICQQTAAFDFPRTRLPECFHYVGPFQKSSLRTVPFPFEQLTGQPLIYASLGTLQNRRQEIFHYIAAACEGLGCQLVISLGGGGRPEELQNLPGTPLVVKYAPQRELLAKATLTITHGGLNTTLESLSYGVPMVAIPIATDQPGVGARLRWTGAGEVVPLAKLNIPRLRTAVQRVLTEDSFRLSAAKLQKSILQSGGVVQAADIVDQVIATGQPVLTGHIRSHK
ncbi:MAG: glycosyl transferase family 1 [Chroococcidiopsidaceae cyanobacterium CP_BM_RX_35]|nr:glycosyl transferase family 1 [Chroococcidiopsidaceae cyanobacterium CP_BM_RX_35]